MKGLIAGLFFMLIPAVSLLAQNTGIRSETEFIVKRISQEEGLPQNNVMKIVQDPRGFLWIATMNGLVRYDGARLAVYDETTHRKITSPMFIDVCVTPDSSVWAYTVREILQLRADTIIRRYSLPAEVESNSMMQFSPTIDGAAVVLLNRKLYYFFYGAFIPVPMEPLRCDYFRLAGKHRILISTGDDRLLLFDRRKNSLSFIDLISEHHLLSDDTDILYWDRDYRLIRLDPKDPASRQVVFSSGGKPVHATSAQHGVAFTLRDSLYVSPDARHFYTAPLRIFSTPKIGTAFFDNERIWLGSSNGGLFRLTKKNLVHHDPEGISRAHEIHFARSFGPFVYTGSCQGLFRYDIYNGSYKRIAAGNKEYCFWDAEFLNDSTLALGTYGDGLLLMRDGKITSYRYPHIPSNNVFCLYRSASGMLWIGTAQGTVVMTQPGKFVAVKTPGGASINAYQFTEKKNGEIYIVSDGGLLLAGTDLRIKQHLTIRNKLPTDNIRSLYLDSEERLWIGTLHRGLCLLSGDLVFTFPHGDGDLSDDVLSIIEDGRGDLWMSSNYGLYRVKKSELLDHYYKKTYYGVTRYSVAEGLRNAEFNSHTQGKACKTPDGSLWWPNINGLVSVKPDKRAAQKKVSRVLIDGIYADNRNLGSGPGTIKVPLATDRVTIVYTIPEFIAPDKVFFEYMIGNNGKWIPNHNRREISLLALREGVHDISIRRQNDARTTVSLRIQVTAPFLYSRLLKTILSVITGILIIITFILVQKQASRKKIRKIQEEKEILSLKMIALQKQIDPHFIFNSLHSLQILFYTNKFEEGNAYLSKFSNLLRSLLEYSRNDVSNLENEMELVNNYLELEKLQFDEGTFIFEVSVEEGIPMKQVLIPAFLLQPFVENAIKHGLRSPSEPVRKLRVSVRKTGKDIRISITDNGKGLREKKNANGAHQHISRGLEIMQNKISVFNKAYNQNISFRLSNRSDGKQGAEVIIDIESWQNT